MAKMKIFKSGHLTISNIAGKTLALFRRANLDGNSTNDLITNFNTYSQGIFLLIVSGWAVFTSWLTWKISTERQDYSDLDNMYQDFLSKAVDDPKLRNPIEIERYLQMEQNKDEHIRYGVYAYMAFDFCESVFDYTRGKKNSKNRQAWMPAVVAETWLHWKWFFDPDNFAEFDDETRIDILGTIAKYPETFDSHFQDDFRTYATYKILNNVNLQNKEEFVSKVRKYVEEGPKALLSQLPQKDF
jgi:hypothetical protein